MATINDIQLGDIIRFSSLNPNDNNTYYGKVKGFIDYSIAVKYRDIVSYNNSVKLIVSSTPDYQDNKYFFIELMEEIDNTPIQEIVFALEWINESTLSIVTDLKIATLKVYGVTNDNINDLLTLIRGADFRVSLVSLD